MSLPMIFVTAFLTALSGALMPGPVLFVTIRHSAAGGRWAGPLVVLGHAVVEIPLMLAVVLGLKDVLSRSIFIGIVGLAGGGVLLAMSAGMLKSLPKLHLPGKGEPAGDRPAALHVAAAGAVTSVSNPYFFLWWATAGLRLLAAAAVSGLPGYVLFYIGHILADLAWYTGVSESVHRGRRAMSDGAYRWLVGVLAVLLAGFAVWFGWDGLMHLLRGAG
jgi:threonine/homoserine/homoserine lactone efflux protein